MTKLEQVALAISEFDLDGASGEYEQELMKAARAAVEALRDPSEALFDEGFPIGDVRPSQIWSDMIDAILRGCRD
jgi:hypothetical protein